jgi:hypothetical protein
MQYARLNFLWQTIGGLLAPVVLTVLLIQKFTDPDLNLYQWLMWLHVPFLFMHEYEEYVITPDGFKKFVNTHTLISSNPPQEDVPVNDEMIFVINIVGWIWAIAGALLARIAPWIGAGFLILQILINCITHPVIFQLKRKAYNPGLATTLGILIPYITFVFWYIVANNLFTTTDWILTFVLGVGVSAQLPIWSINRLKSKTAP